jgi:tetratricopeptide (TPR) repeat protein
VDLLRHAADCYERAELLHDAARCYREAGMLVSAGRAYDKAGDLIGAADCYRAGNELAAAARLYREAGRPADAADCWESVGDLLNAGWVLATQTPEIRRALRMLTEAPATDTSRRLRRVLGIGVCQARSQRRRPEALERALASCQSELASMPRQADRQEVVEWAVVAASLVNRADLAALVLAASYRCGTADAAQRWRQWSASTLGGTFGVPAPAPIAPQAENAQAG